MKLRLISVMMAVAALCAAQPVAAQSPTADQCNDAYSRDANANAYRLCLPLAKQGDAEAQYKLGYMYETGKGVERDVAAAAIWYRKAAEQGDAWAQRNVDSLVAENPQVFAQQPRERRNETPRPSPPATPPIASQIDQCDAAYKRDDYANAFSLCGPIAEQGGAREQSYVGYMYETGKGVERDVAAAAIWFRKAAEQGIADAQFNLGVMYDNGRGVPQDYVQAHKWYNLAAVSGDADAVKNRDLAAAKMTPAQIVEAQKLATEFKPRAETATGGVEETPSNNADSPDQGWMWWVVLLGLVPLGGFLLLVKPAMDREEAEREKAQRARAEQEKAERAQREREKVQKDKAEKEKAERENAERARAGQEKAQKDKAEREKTERARTRGGSSWYEVLGVAEDASSEEVRRAYRALIAQYHPDKVSGLGEEFQEIAEKKSREINNAYAAYKKARA